MVDELDRSSELLTQLGHNIANSLEVVEWEIAWIEVEAITDGNKLSTIDVVGQYQEVGTAKIGSFDNNDQISNIILEMWDLIKKDEDSYWRSFKYTLRSDGNFKIDFNYDKSNPTV